MLHKINKYGAMLILTAPLWVNNNFIFPYMHFKNIFFRVLVLGLLISLVWYILEKNKRSLKKNLIIYAWLVFIIVLSLAAILGVNTANSFWGNWERMDGVINIILLGVYLCLLSVIFRTKADWIELFRSSIIIAGLVGIFGLFRAGLDMANNQWSTLGNSAFLGFYTVLNLGILGILSVLDKNKKWRWFYIIMGIFLLFILLGAASRAPILALVFALLLTGLLYLPRANKKIKIYTLIAFVVIAVIIGVALINKEATWVKQIHFLDRLVHISKNDNTTNNRLLVWQSAWQGWQEKPLTGWGPENLSQAVNKYYNPLISEQWFDRAHNFIIDYLTSTGVLGLLAYLNIFGVAVYGLWKVKKENYLLAVVSFSWLMLYLVTNLFVFDTLNSWLIVIMWLAWVSWLMRMNENEEVDEIELIKLIQKNYYIVLGLVVLVSVIGIYNVAYLPMRANYLVGQAYRYSQADPDKSLNLYNQVIAMNVLGKREAVLQLGRYALKAIKAPEASLATKKKVFNTAEEQMLIYLKKHPHDIQMRIALAQNYLAYSKLNTFYINEAVNLLKDNIKDSPRRLEVYYMIAEAYYMKKDLKMAVNYLEQAYKVTHQVESVYENLMNIYSQLGQADKVDEIIQAYFKEFPNLEAEQYRKASEYYFRVGLIEKSKQVLIEKAIPANPNMWRSYISLASIYQAEGNIQQAIDYLNEVLVSHPEFKDIIGDYLKVLEQ